MANITYVKLNNFITETQHRILELLNQELKFDKEADSWLFMSTPWPVLSILVFYLIFVLKIGPLMMKNRRPLNIKYIMMLYNFIQTIYNMFIVSKFFLTPGVPSEFVRNICHPDYTEKNVFLINMYYIQSWHYFLSKIFDLLDTVSTLGIN